MNYELKLFVFCGYQPFVLLCVVFFSRSLAPLCPVTLPQEALRRWLLNGEPHGSSRGRGSLWYQNGPAGGDNDDLISRNYCELREANTQPDPVLRALLSVLFSLSHIFQASGEARTKSNMKISSSPRCVVNTVSTVGEELTHMVHPGPLTHYLLGSPRTSFGSV